MPTSCWLKHLCSIRALVPVSFLPSFLPPSLPSFSFSFSLWLIPWSAEARWAHFLAWASKTLSRRRTVPSPTPKGTWCLRAAARALRMGLYWLSSETRGHQPLSLSYLLIVDSGPPASGPLKDQQVAPEQALWYTWLRTEWPPGPIEAGKYWDMSKSAGKPPHFSTLLQHLFKVQVFSVSRQRIEACLQTVVKCNPWFPYEGISDRFLAPMGSHWNCDSAISR